MIEFNTTPDTMQAYLTEISNVIMQANPETKEYFGRRGNMFAAPNFLKLLNFYCITKDILIFLTAADVIKRSTDVGYYLNNLARKTVDLTENHTVYGSPLGISKPVLDNLNVKDIFGLHIIYVTGQIQDTFETHIPNWAAACGATESLGVSLALKLTPKHRIRVYQRNEHIIVFTTKGFENMYGDNYELYRKLWACIPLLRGWVEAGEPLEDYKDVLPLCKALANTDATEFWRLLETAYNNSSEIKDLKYNSIIQAFNNMKNTRINAQQNTILDINRQADQHLSAYTRALEQIRQAQRVILEIQQFDTGLDTDCIKRLVDKKICYALNTNSLNTSDALISYRVAAPLLSYDKNAALVYFNKHIKEEGSATLETIFKLLFVDEKVVLNFDEAIDIKLNTGTIQAKMEYTCFGNDLNQFFPNPHHAHYNCWGSYGPVIVKLIHEYKLEELFYQIKAAVGSLNFTDYPVVSQFTQHLYNIVDGTYNPRCFLWRDENCTISHDLKETLEHFNEEATE